jgi:hypothetical protein
MTTGGSMMTIQAINPATSEVLKTYEEMAPVTVRDIVSKTHEAFLGWRRTTFSDRAGRMRKAAEILRANAGEYARLWIISMASCPQPVPGALGSGLSPCELSPRGREPLSTSRPSVPAAIRSPRASFDKPAAAATINMVFIALVSVLLLLAFAAQRTRT